MIFDTRTSRRSFETFKWVLLTQTRLRSFRKINKNKKKKKRRKVKGETDRKEAHNQPDRREVVVKTRWLFSAVLLDRWLPYQYNLLPFSFSSRVYERGKNLFLFLFFSNIPTNARRASDNAQACILNKNANRWKEEQSKKNRSIK